MKLLELMGTIERMEDLVRRFYGRRDAQGNVHTIAEDSRMSSLEALLSDDLEKYVQLNRMRLTSFGVLREEIKTYCVCRGHANARNAKPKVHHTQVEMTRWTSVRLTKARANRAKASTASAKGSKDNKDKNNDSI